MVSTHRHRLTNAEAKPGAYTGGNLTRICDADNADKISYKIISSRYKDVRIPKLRCNPYPNLSLCGMQHFVRTSAHTRQSDSNL